MKTKQATAKIKATKPTKTAAAAKPAKKAKAVKTPAATAPAVAKQATSKVTKKETILTMLRQPGGATLTDLAAATSWARNFTQGFISTTVRAKLGLKPESFKTKEGERAYRLA